MRNFLMMAAALVGLTVATSAFAASPDPVNSDRSGFFVGGKIGAPVDNKSRIDTGLNAGYQINSFVRVEADYDHVWRNKGNANMLVGNAVVQYRIPSTSVTPYAFAGVGVGFDGYGYKSGTVTTLYDAGVGARLGVSANVDLDVRYTFVRPFNVKAAATKESNMLTVGASYRF